MDGMGTARQYLHHANHALHVQGRDNYCQTLSSGAGNSGPSIAFLHVEFIMDIAIEVSPVWLCHDGHRSCATCGGGNWLDFDFGVAAEVPWRNEGILFFISCRHCQQSAFVAFGRK